MSNWEDLDADDDVPPPAPAHSLIVDRTPLMVSRKKEFSFNEKTPLISHKSSSGLGSKPTKHRHSTLPKVYSVSILQEDGSSLGNNAESTNDDEKSISSAASILSWSTATSVLTLSTAYLGNFKSSLMLPFTDETGSLPKVVAGLLSLFAVGIALGLIMPKNPNLPDPLYRDVSSIIGYTYFLCWSVCFYPQVIQNFRRKSTAGLSHDFAVLNFLGWACYSAYECAMFFDKDIIALYQQRFKSTDNTVQSNDVMFAVHAFALAITYLGQIVYYGGGLSAFRIKRQTWIFLFAIGTPSIVGPLLIWSGVLNFGRWLDYFYMLSFLKISCTLTKYIKQMSFNIERQSTKGWNIWYNFLECVGGSMSMLQVVLDSANMGDWTGVTGNMAKFALGFLTISFDVIFFMQHYVIYPDVVELKKEADIENMHLTLSRSSSVDEISLTGTA